MHELIKNFIWKTKKFIYIIESIIVISESLETLN